MRIYRLNQMYLSLAREEQRFLESVFGARLEDVRAIDGLPLEPVDVLVVGRQHLEGSTYRYGHELVWTAVLRCRPRVLIYTVPGTFEHDRYTQDTTVLGTVKSATRVFVLELAVLKELLPDEAVRSARRSLAKGTPTMLEEPFERLVSTDWTDSAARALGREPGDADR